MQGIRGLLVARARTTIYWRALFRAAMLLLVLAQTWWAIFGLRGQVEWTFCLYAVVLLHVTLLDLVAALALLLSGETVSPYFADHL
ncbi:MAG: hypothetical protein JWN21_2503 [Sphingomonas bacterium]|uniref:hypothetical protein n=1 Tax=Sphingomonas bacterium TaxID=1895847 RepID=UPI00261CA26A|nr:hypothetical protein [Sphingomonas bacterium]MDB5696960.1 hypothetical protein [Sphingomonas bacterium]